MLDPYQDIIYNQADIGDIVIIERWDDGSEYRFTSYGRIKKFRYIGNTKYAYIRSIEDKEIFCYSRVGDYRKLVGKELKGALEIERLLRV